ncbi:MAG TPA: hypothetical protein VFB38_00240 [Chthonomonadaceae bacterium]|nr:hypothetical protein [Chthonomonadaceae bacterium]
MDVNALQTASAGMTANLLRAADQNPEVAAKLLKKAMESDRNLVDTLLPTVSSVGSRLDIRA